MRFIKQNDVCIAAVHITGKNGLDLGFIAVK